MLQFKKDGSIQQSELTSCGLNRGPLSGSGIYPAYLACQLFTEVPSVYVGGDAFPRIMQDGRDGDEENGYVANIKDTATLGFKYFDIRHIKRIGIATRGYASGDFEIRLMPQGEKIATIHVENTNVWEWAYTDVDIPDGIHSLYFTYRGEEMLRLPHFRWKPERVTMSSFRESEFFCKRGHLIIRGTAFLPIKSCKGVVIVSHGLNQNRKPFL